MNVTLDILDHATPAIEAKIARCSPGRLPAVVGPALMILTRDHLKGNPRNKRGFPSTGFWEKAARATDWQPEGGAVRLRIAQLGVRQRYYGGAITPVEKKALAIPINGESYGKTPADFENLKLIVIKGRGAYLAQSAFEKTGVTQKGSRTIRGKNNIIARETLTFLFILLAGVEQEGNPDIIPSQDEYAEVAMARIEEAIQ